LVLAASDGVADGFDPLTLATHLKKRIVDAHGDISGTIEAFLAEINDQLDEDGLFHWFDDNLTLALLVDGSPFPAAIPALD
jgi:hypothetical protein